MDEFPRLPIRPRRLRMQPQLRHMLGEITLRRSDIIVPIFVCEGTAVRREVSSMPGVHQMSVDVALEYLQQRSSEGFLACILFGVLPSIAKDATGSAALDEGNVICRLLKAVQAARLPMACMTDLCLCEYTDHGHCGPLTADGSSVDNDATLPLLVRQAINHARSGAAVIAPSGMMDGTVATLRRGLDDAGFKDVAIVSYAVKYASAYYGPFRDAADSAPSRGDRRGYQMDPARGKSEALLEARLDVEQGADMIIVKPALAYLDIVSAVAHEVSVPVVAYQVSGEYAMIEAASQNGWIDRDRVLLESLTAMKRAGANLIVSYYAEALARLLPE